MKISTLIQLLLLISSPHIIKSQSTDASKCPNCSFDDIEIIKKVQTKLLGLMGQNPYSHVIYNYPGWNKYSSSNFVYEAYEEMGAGKNWYPLSQIKETVCGTIHSFSTSDIDGDEMDWNILVKMDPTFDYLMERALKYKGDCDFGSTVVSTCDWYTDKNGSPLVEAEITPDESRYKNQWFSRGFTSPLINKKACFYGPFVREEAHGSRPEIHPCEQIWWLEGGNNGFDQNIMVLLVIDDSNRFEDTEDFLAAYDCNTPRDWTPWAQEKNQPALLKLPFEIDPEKETFGCNIEVVDRIEIANGLEYLDDESSIFNTLQYKGKTVVSAGEDPREQYDKKLGISFENVCFNNNTKKLHGYIAIRTGIGNGENHEGFMALRIGYKINKK